jgi:uncharacterized protein
VAIKFEWDPTKADANFRKHGVRFETASRVFSDVEAFIELDRIVDGEVRWKALGIVDRFIMLLVVHVVREEGNIEVIRIVSAREADRREKRHYEEQNG